ncbi:MAG: hypothetical protein HWD60_11870 [Defluviicoccus sp.]|nr:MAG: hypothetical protein HWD60_11870 [Defluviicoccus sp.]
MLKRMAAQSGIETPSADDLVADKGYHSRAVLKDLDGASGARRGREAARQWQHRRWIEPMEVLR